MQTQQLVEALDTRILSGDVIGAFEQFAADNCVTLSSPNDITHNKAQKLEALRWFFDNVASANRIERVACEVVDDHVTESQFVFDFTNRQGEPLVFNEVIRRTWKNGQLVEEQYLANQTVTAKKAAKKATVKAEPKAAEPKAAKAEKTAKKATVKAEPKAAEPKADKKPATKSAAKQDAGKAAKK